MNCPQCYQRGIETPAVETVGNSYRCAAGHAFQVSRHGDGRITALCACDTEKDMGTSYASSYVAHENRKPSWLKECMRETKWAVKRLLIRLKIIKPDPIIIG